MAQPGERKWFPSFRGYVLKECMQLDNGHLVWAIVPRNQWGDDIPVGSTPTGKPVFAADECTHCGHPKHLGCCKYCRSSR